VAVGGQIALSATGVRGVPVVNVENACASASTALWLAVNHLRAGQADVALAVGTEKMVFQEPEQVASVMKAFEGGMDVEDVDGVLARLSTLGEGVSGPSGDGHRTVFMEMYANIARTHMKRFGTTQEQMAVVASKNHGHASLNPRCHYNKPMTVEQILGGRPLSYPLTVPMCSPLSDGSAAALLCTRAGLARLKVSPRVKVLSCVLRSSTERDFFDFENHICRRAAKQAFAEAAVGPEDVSVAEVHDAAAFGEIFQSELLGFCAFGDGGPLAESGATRLGGAKPINVSGGLESKGHPIGATGLGQIFELVTQLRGEAGPRQVDGARIALQENGGGLLGVEEASAVVTILSRE
jgi:acetyl-CoA acetyltransferase